MSENWVEVAAKSEIAEGTMIGVKVGGTELAIYNVAGEFFATSDWCTHAFANLTDGWLEGEIVECPLHGGAFNVKTGAGTCAPITEAVKTFPVRVAGDAIEVQVA